MSARMRGGAGAVVALVALAALAHAAPATRAAAGATPRHAAAHHATATARAKPDGAPRRLTDVHIEGEMPVPQVLFITARDQRRYVDFQHQRYLRDSRALGAATVAPTRVSTTPETPKH